jgi:hypothetical protein
MNPGKNALPFLTVAVVLAGLALSLAAAAEAARLLEFPASLFSSGKEYTKDPLALLRYREKVAAAIETLTAR